MIFGATLHWKPEILYIVPYTSVVSAFGAPLCWWSWIVLPLTLVVSGSQRGIVSVCFSPEKVHIPALLAFDLIGLISDISGKTIQALLGRNVST